MWFVSDIKAVFKVKCAKSHANRDFTVKLDCLKQQKQIPGSFKITFRFSFAVKKTHTNRHAHCI